MLRGTTTDFYEADGLGSITSLTNSSGANAQTYTYDSFGNLTASSGSLTNSFRYAGREFDSETGLYFYRARYYDATTGRFLSEDPANFGAELNFYRYVANNPALFTDPFGLHIVVPGDNGDYQQAINYLSRDPGMAAIIHDLDASSTTYTLVYNNIGNDSYDPWTHTINWDPRSGLCLRGGRGKQSPALGLGHEMAHADAPWYWRLIGWVPWPHYDNLEERRVITGPETNAARTLGEGTRTDHLGQPCPVPTPTSH